MYQNGILKPGLKLIGAKTKIRSVLYERFPEHNAYIEPFLGTGGVLIGKPKSCVEVGSDTNVHLINYYQCLQRNPEDWWAMYELTLHEISTYPSNHKVLFELLKVAAITSPSPIKRAVCFYLVTKFCMNGIWRLNQKGECNSSYCGTMDGRGLWTREWFDAVVKRINNVQFCNTSADHMLNWGKCDYKDAFIFLDPPYHDCKTTYNGQAFKDEDFILLANKLGELQSKWMLTINDDPFIRNLFSKWNTFEHDVNYSCSQTNAGRGRKPELIITNY